MAELNVPACPTHGSIPRALHPENFEGIVTVIESIIETVSGVGTVSYSRCPYGYPWNFEGVVRALEDLNTSISGIQGGGGDIAAGSGIYFTSSGTSTVINATIASASGVSISAGSGIYLSDAGTKINLNAQGQGSVAISYSGNVALISGTSTGGSTTGASVTVSGEPADGYTTGSLWFDTNEGRLFVYASGGAVSDPAWYQTNAEGLALMGDIPPSGTGSNAPPRQGSIWFNTMLGSLFVYDAVTSGWYEASSQRAFAYGSAAPAALNAPGAGWYDTSANVLKVWNGSSWVSA